MRSAIHRTTRRGRSVVPETMKPVHRVGRLDADFGLLVLFTGVGEADARVRRWIRSVRVDLAHDLRRDRVQFGQALQQQRDVAGFVVVCRRRQAAVLRTVAGDPCRHVLFFAAPLWQSRGAGSAAGRRVLVRAGRLRAQADDPNCLPGCGLWLSDLATGTPLRKSKLGYQMWAIGIYLMWTSPTSAARSETRYLATAPCSAVAAAL